MCPKVYGCSVCQCCQESQSGNVGRDGDGSGNGNGNGDGRGQHEQIQQDSTYSGQPNDSEVWDMLVDPRTSRWDPIPVAIVTDDNIGKDQDDLNVIATEVQHTTMEQNEIEIVEQSRN